MGEDSSMELVREVAALGAKMDLVLKNQAEMQQNLSSNYMPRAEIESRMERQGERTGRLESRVRDIEQSGRGLFFMWAAVITSCASLAVALFAALRK